MNGNFVDSLANLLNSQGAVALLGRKDGPNSSAAPSASTNPDGVKNAKTATTPTQPADAGLNRTLLIGGAAVLGLVLVVAVLRRH